MDGGNNLREAMATIFPLPISLLLSIFNDVKNSAHDINVGMFRNRDIKQS